MTKLIKLYFQIFALILTPLCVFAQNSAVNGLPPLKNFSPKQYQHYGKIWDIAHANNGLIYLASDKGLVEYDGEQWQLFRGSDGITRSVYVVNDSLIYTGSDTDFGKWERNAKQAFDYTSLYPFKDDLNEINEEFWNVYAWENQLVFTSSNNLYLYGTSGLTKLPTPSPIAKVFVLNDKLYLADTKGGLFIVKNLEIQKIAQLETSRKMEIVGLKSDQSTLIIVTKNDGIYSLNDGRIKELELPISAQLKQTTVFSFSTLSNQQMAFGTIREGLLIADSAGSKIHHLTTAQGLLNNTVLSIHQNADGVVWLGLDFGVSAIDLRSHYRFYYDLIGQFGTGYTSTIYDGLFYLGTNQGLYVAAWDSTKSNNPIKGDLKLLDHSEGQVWEVKSVDNTLFVSHDNGLFRLKNNQLQEVNTDRGFFTVERYGSQPYLLGGTYNGIAIFEKRGNEWTYLKKMEQILGSCNQIVVEREQVVWFNIPNFGVIRAELDADLTPTNREIYLKEAFNNEDVQINIENQLVRIVTKTHTYEYDQERKNFTIEERERLPETNSSLILANRPKTVLNADYHFLPIYGGFALEKNVHSKSLMHSATTILVRSIEAFSNQGTKLLSNGEEIPYSLNNVRIQARVASFQEVIYQYKHSLTEDWSKWSDESTIELINLPKGSHRMQIRAKVGSGQISETAEINFMIRTPWYRSPYMMACYVILMAALFYLLNQLKKKELRQQEIKLLEKQKKEWQVQEDRYRNQLEATSKLQLEAKYEDIKEQLKSKTMQLAAKAKENEEQQSVLLELKNRIIEIEQHPERLKSSLKDIKGLLSNYLDIDHKTFEIQIDELNQDFFKIIRDKYDDITLNDLRLCAYIKIGFNAKEIADIMNIKPSSVYISRSRLRKKLELHNDTDLYTFLNSL